MFGENSRRAETTGSDDIMAFLKNSFACFGNFNYNKQVSLKIATLRNENCLIK